VPPPWSPQWAELGRQPRARGPTTNGLRPPAGCRFSLDCLQRGGRFLWHKRCERRQAERGKRGSPLSPPPGRVSRRCLLDRAWGRRPARPTRNCQISKSGGVVCFSISCVLRAPSAGVPSMCTPHRTSAHRDTGKWASPQSSHHTGTAKRAPSPHDGVLGGRAHASTTAHSHRRRRRRIPRSTHTCSDARARRARRRAERKRVSLSGTGRRRSVRSGGRPAPPRWHGKKAAAQPLESFMPPLTKTFSPSCSDFSACCMKSSILRWCVLSTLSPQPLDLSYACVRCCEDASLSGA
jgi:hypothetical protein